MADDIIFDCETCDAAGRIAALEAENEKLRADKAAWQGVQQGTADVVKQLEKENAKLRAALKLIAETYNKPTTSKDGLAFIAAATLKEQSDE